MEALRQRLGVERWLLLGGSWGAALALAYAETHPERVSGMVLRGVFTARRSELDWLYREGASRLHPEAWWRFLAPIPEPERHDLIGAYHARLSSGDPDREREAARAWCAWEDELITLSWRTPPGPVPSPTGDDDARLLALARIGAHYARHAAFLDEGRLLGNAWRLRDVPGVIVQGRDDAVTPVGTALELHRAWPGSELRLVEGAGHASGEPGIARALCAATDGLAARLLSSRS